MHFAGHKCDSITSFLSFHQFNSIKDRAKQLAQINKYPEKEIAAEIIAKYCSSDAEADDSSSSNNSLLLVKTNSHLYQVTKALLPLARI